MRKSFGLDDKRFIVRGNHADRCMSALPRFVGINPKARSSGEPVSKSWVWPSVNTSPLRSVARFAGCPVKKHGFRRGKRHFAAQSGHDKLAAKATAQLAKGAAATRPRVPQDVGQSECADSRLARAGLSALRIRAS